MKKVYNIFFIWVVIRQLLLVSLKIRIGTYLQYYCMFCVARGVEPRTEQYGIELASITSLPATVIERARYLSTYQV